MPPCLFRLQRSTLLLEGNIADFGRASRFHIERIGSQHPRRPLSVGCFQLLAVSLVCGGDNTEIYHGAVVDSLGRSRQLLVENSLVTKEDGPQPPTLSPSIQLHVCPVGRN